MESNTRMREGRRPLFAIQNFQEESTGKKVERQEQVIKCYTHDQSRFLFRRMGNVPDIQRAIVRHVNVNTEVDLQLILHMKLL